MLNRKSGFTLIELVLVMVILGILATVAIPRFIDLRQDAQKAAADGIVAAGNAGAHIWYAKNLIDPTNYTTKFPLNTNTATSNMCFDGNVFPSLPAGIAIGNFNYNQDNGIWSHNVAGGS